MRSPHHRPRPARRLAATAVVVAAVAAGVSGCSGTSAPPRPTSSATTASTPPPDPTPNATSSTQDPAFRPGAPGLGDPYFPLEGNGGYDVGHYDLTLSYTPAGHHLAGTVTVTATATQNLSRFDLDLTGMTVATVTVGGAQAGFTRSGPELQITPAHGLAQGHPFVVAVTYAGTPKTIVSTPVVFGAAYGWIYTNDGAFVGDEPNGASTWFPSNDHPSDKATFSFEITVPSSLKVVANGDLVGQRTSGATTTFGWNETSPMATYLATIGIGRWTFARSHTPAGIPELVAYDPSLAGPVAATKDAQLTGQVTDYWATKFGPYPFTSTGAIIDHVPGIGFSLETQTRPLYGFTPDPNTLSHELAHQWFGDSVSVQTWRDIWLNEGFATFAANLWLEHTGGTSTWAGAQQTFADHPARSPFWNRAIADPQRDTMFSQAVYVRGGLTLAALRHRIGDATFFTLLQKWTAAHHFGNATTAQFIALANQVSGQDLSHFFRIWLYTKARPASLSAR